MTERKRSAMVVNKSGGGKDFEPDPLLDPKRQYDARIIGFAHIGIHEKPEYKDGKATGEILEQEQCLIAFELVEEETYVERGPEGAKTMEPRIMFKWEKYSSHEKSNLYKIASKAHPDAVWIEKKQGQVDPLMMINQPVMIKLINNKDGDKQNIKEVDGYPAKFASSVGEAKSDQFMFSVNVPEDLFADCEIDLSKVPPWVLSKSLNDAINADSFACIEAMEAQVDLNEAAKEAAKANSGKLEGDEKPATDTSKAKSKASKPKEEVKEEEEKVADEKPARRPRRNRKAEGETVDYSEMGIEELEKILIDKDVSEDELDELDSEGTDEAYQKALAKKAASL